MREGRFLKRNIDRWQSYLEDETDPDKKAKRFMHIIDDLGFSKTFYPHSATTKYLNGIAAKIYTSVYNNKKVKQNRLWNFWAYEIPYIFGKYWRIYLFTFLFFLSICLLAVVSSILDNDFIADILGSGYVEKTNENIDNGDPFGVYKDSHPLFMFVYIAANNVYVMLKTYAMGIFGGIGTLYILFSNGLMLGSFQYMFFEKGLGWDSVLVIWIHGALEINAIVLAGTAGLILGFSYLFPGTSKRLESLKQGAKDSIKIMISLIPIILLAAVFESWVTRHTEMPNALKLGIIVLSFLFIIFYYIIWPYSVRKRGFSVKDGVLYKNSKEVLSYV